MTRERRETVLADVRPELNYLSYRPHGRTYHLLTTWGHSGNHPYSNATCTFSVVNIETGAELERSAPLTEGNALRARPEWLALVRELNA